RRNTKATDSSNNKATGRKPLSHILSPYASMISPLLLLAAWQIIAQAGLVAPEVLVPPLGVWQAFCELLESGDLAMHLGNSLWRLTVGFSIGAAIGLVLGSAMGASRQVQAYVNPLFQFIRPLPTVALIPAFVMFFGVGETIKLVLVAKATALLITLATFEAVKGIPRTWLEVAAVYKAPPLTLLFRVILPATVPPVLTGLRLALGRSWMVLVAAELLVSENGLGQMMEHGRQMFRLDIVMVCVVLTGVIGWSLDRAVRALEWQLVRWQHR
ncbi:MAG TPA: ABC transporter permease, partial [Candidatus Methylacidiphilales bacterium]|nr:ABC transporter permease [Candidatus Methylacidiphilales bacterium]